MTAYQNFAAVYDELMSDIPYNRYAELLELAVGTSFAHTKLLDIGCGTGLLAVQLAKKGAEVIGIDISPSMLEVAKARAASLCLPIHFEQQSMQQLTGFSNIDAAVISIDSINYVIEKEDVTETFRRIYQALRKGGVLLFDVHSTYKMDEIFLDGPFTFDNERIAYIWETEEAEWIHSVYSELAFFVRTTSGQYERFDEVHLQRTWPVHEYVHMLTSVGFEIERIFADWEDEPPSEESERIFFQVRK